MNEPDTNQAITAADVSGLLKHLQRCGVTFLPKSQVVVQPKSVAAARSSEVAKVAAAAATVTRVDVASVRVEPALPMPASRLTSSPTSASQAATIAVADAYHGASLPLAERINRLETLAGEVSGCPRCEVLVCSRKHTVFGEGNPEARVCFFGEAPGADEDATGRPFVGRSGMLLTKMIEACTFSREQVYILNTIKCRPPGNRNPEPVEIANCRPYFEQQLDIIRPQYIVCLGLVAVQTLLGSTLSIGRLRGRFHRYHDSKVVATYHPSYLLRNPEVKREAWSDLKMLMRDMGIEADR
jgi:uracil-DNA glycosylase